MCSVAKLLVTLEPNDRFVCVCSFEERQKPRTAGFRWDASSKEWCTYSPQVAAKFYEYCTPEAKIALSKILITVNKFYGLLEYPKGLNLRTFQKEAAFFALERNRSYLALDPGIGKTVIAAVIYNTVRMPTVYICPPFLVKNVEAEFSRWCPGIKVHTERVRPVFQNCLWIIPDSLIIRDDVLKEIKSYLKQHQNNTTETLIFVDEAHRFKNDTSKRTQALFSFAKHFDKAVLLSGTPVPNRPIELFPILTNMAPETIDFRTKYQFGERYCAAFFDRMGHWDYSGASNIAELSKKVHGKFMLRMRKSDVLKELPPKVEEMVILNGDIPNDVMEMDSYLLRKYSPEDIMKGVLKEPNSDKELHLATYRRKLGEYKAEESAKYIKDVLENSTESILIFAIHKATVEILRAALADYDPLVITGETSVPARQGIVDCFQLNPARRVFIGNIQAAGIGFTLTKATRVIFVEFSWVPGDNDQASDRAHRIGQLDSVFVQYLVYANSVDASVLHTLFKKRHVTGYI